MFSRYRRHPLDHRNLARSFKDLLKSAGLPQSVRLCDLRHTCATLLLNGCVHPKHVQKLLSYASIAQMMDTYLSVLKSKDGRIDDVME